MKIKKKLILNTFALIVILANIIMPQKVFAINKITNETNYKYQNINYIDLNTVNNNEALKVEYSIEEDKVEFKDDNGVVRGIVSFQYPQFIGNSSYIEKINKQIKEKSNKFLSSENAEMLKDCVQAAIENNRFYDDSEQYFWKTSCEVSYNKNNIVSFHMTENWYAGGVGNQFEYGLNYNIKTGKKLKINNVISGNSKEKILKSAKKYCNSDNNAYDIIKNTESYKFYFTKGKVYICYGSYELEHGNTIDKFSVKGKYK